MKLNSNRSNTHDTQIHMHINTMKSTPIYINTVKCMDAKSFLYAKCEMMHIRSHFATRPITYREYSLQTQSISLAFAANGLYKRM